MKNDYRPTSWKPIYCRSSFLKVSLLQKKLILIFKKRSRGTTKFPDHPNASCKETKTTEKLKKKIKFSVIRFNSNQLIVSFNSFDWLTDRQSVSSSVRRPSRRPLRSLFINILLSKWRNYRSSDWIRFVRFRTRRLLLAANDSDRRPHFPDINISFDFGAVSARYVLPGVFVVEFVILLYLVCL